MTATNLTPRGSIAGSVAETMALSKRAVTGAIRQPASWIPGLAFPFLIAAVYSSQFAKAVDLPDFPFEDATFLEFVLIANVLQGVAFGSINGASALARDIEAGFMDRLLSSPVARPSILIGRLAGSMVFAAFQATVLTIVFTIMGARISGGLATIATVLIVAMLLALAVGSLGSAIALRTGSQEVVQSVFPVIFVFIFVSSAFFPVELMEGWYQDLARWNPITWIIDPTRRLTLDGFSLRDFAQAVGTSAALALGGVLVAFVQLRRRLAKL